MHVYKYPLHWSTSSEVAELQPSSVLRSELHRENTRFKMLCSRCVLPFLALYMLLEEMSAAVLPSRFRNKREVSWLDQELFSHLLDHSDQRDLSVGDAGEMGRDVDGHPFQLETFLPTEHLSLQRQNQYQYHRKANEKRRKVAPLDSIGGFQMSSFRNQKDEPDIYWEEHRE